jgi:hypothetical protein
MTTTTIKVTPSILFRVLVTVWARQNGHWTATELRPRLPYIMVGAGAGVDA